MCALLSKIHLNNIRLKVIENFENSLTGLMEDYNVDDCIFTFQNNQLYEVNTGFFRPISTSDNIHELLKSFDNDINAIRIQENKTFTIGALQTDITEGELIDCYSLEKI